MRFFYNESYQKWIFFDVISGQGDVIVSQFFDFNPFKTHKLIEIHQPDLVFGRSGGWTDGEIRFGDAF